MRIKSFMSIILSMLITIILSFAAIVSAMEVCFTPPVGCAAVIAKEISKAKDSIYVQAYGLTSRIIVDELINAHDRGVKIRILLDRSNIKDKYSRMTELQDAGVEVGIDKVSGIAHNKVMIIDGRTVITGSFNFTNSADTRNAENVLIVEDKNLADKYFQNWLNRKHKNDQKLHSSRLKRD